MACERRAEQQDVDQPLAKSRQCDDSKHVGVRQSIEAADLEEAMDKFGEAMGQAVERMIEEAREIQRQEASRIIVPGAAPAGGKIKLG